MKIIKLLIILISTNINSQVLIIDSTAIKFKASLFTLSEYGVASKEIIFKDIEEQRVTFLNTKYKKFCFLKVDFSQPYRTSDISSTTLIRNCSYYIAFNIKSKKFYKLGGFDNVDIDDFITDLETLEGVNIIDWDSGNEIEEIDILCLYEYFLLDKKKRFKKKFTCFENCSKNTKTYYIEH